MAAIAFKGYISSAWTDLGANTIVFTGGAFTDKITVGQYQDGTFAGSGDPGTSQGQMNNTKYIDSTHLSINGGGSVVLNDTNLVVNSCALQVNFSDAVAVAISNARLYAFDGATPANEAVGVHIQAFERGVGATTWTLINDDSANIGGDNSGERLPLGDKTAATSHDWNIALSISPESVGAKASVDLGVALTYS